MTPGQPLNVGPYIRGLKASAAAPVLTEGDVVLGSCDLTGAQRVTSVDSSDAVTIADGADVVEGTLADAANTTGTAGTISGKMRGAVQLLNALVACISGGSLMVLIQNATLAVTQSGLWSFAIAPATTGGWSIFSNTALTSTVVAVKSSAAGQVGGWVFHNPSAATTFVQFFNAAGAVTIGSTTPTFSFGIAAGASANVEFTAGIAFSSGIQVAATTTATGSTAPATALVAGIFYK